MSGIFHLKENAIDALPGGVFFRYLNSEGKRLSRQEEIQPSHNQKDATDTNGVGEFLSNAPLILATLLITSNAPLTSRDWLYRIRSNTNLFNVGWDLTTSILSFELVHGLSLPNVFVGLAAYAGAKIGMNFIGLEGKSLWQDRNNPLRRNHR